MDREWNLGRFDLDERDEIFCLHDTPRRKVTSSTFVLRYFRLSRDTRVKLTRTLGLGPALSMPIQKGSALAPPNKSTFTDQSFSLLLDRASADGKMVELRLH